MPTNVQPESVKSLFVVQAYDGTPLGNGTGFVVPTESGHVLLTNRHVVTGRHQESGEPLSKTGGIPNEIDIYHNRRNSLGSWIKKTEPLLDDDGNPLWIEHPTLGSRADFVALPITDVSEIEIYDYDLSDVHPDLLIQPTSVVSVIGFPFGIGVRGAFAIWATGFIASEPEIDAGGLPMFLIDCRSRQGQSGSPVVLPVSGTATTRDGGTAIYARPFTKFLGIYSGRVNLESDLGMVWKRSAIVELISSISSSVAVSP